MTTALAAIGCLLGLLVLVCWEAEPESPEARAVKLNPVPVAEPAPYKLCPLPCGKYLVQTPDGEVLFAPWGVTAAQAATWWRMENESQYKETV